MRLRGAAFVAVPAFAAVVLVVGIAAARDMSTPRPVSFGNEAPVSSTGAPSRTVTNANAGIPSGSATVHAAPVAASTRAGVVFHGPRTDKVIALTFDDGWSTKRCETILDILESRRVAATFFPNAIHVEESPAFWQKVSRLGFPIGNHTYDHKDLRDLSARQRLWEIDHDRAVVEGVIGRAMIPVLRPPFGGVNPDIVASARKAGFELVLTWDTTADDSSRLTKSTMLRHALRGKNGSVVVMHCGPSATPSILDRVIDRYRARGFRFLTIPELLGLPGPTPTFVTRHLVG